jgi:hypothetical protein
MPAAVFRLAAALAAVTALAACDPPLDVPYPAERIGVTRDGASYDAVARYDPVQLAYSVRVWPRMLAGRPLAREEAVALVEERVGPELCEGAPLAVRESRFSLFGDREAARPLESIGGWRILARCA